MGYGGTNNWDSAWVSDKKQGNRTGRFERADVEYRSLSEVYNSNRAGSVDKGMIYIREIVRLQGRIKSLLQEDDYTQSNLTKNLGLEGKEAFVVGVALEYMQRSGSIYISGSRAGPDENMIEPVYSTTSKENPDKKHKKRKTLSPV